MNADFVAESGAMAGSAQTLNGEPVWLSKILTLPGVEETVGEGGEHAGLPESSPPFPKSIPEWANVLKMACRSKRKTVLGLGRVFWAARSNLPFGRWAKLWQLTEKSERPPVSKKTGDKYALIGQEFGEADGKWPTHLLNALPTSVGALHFLAQMGKELVLELILDGAIHERLTEGKARDLRNKYRPDLDKTVAFTLESWLARFHNLLVVLEEKGTPQHLEAAIVTFQKAIASLAVKSAASSCPPSEQAA